MNKHNETSERAELTVAILAAVSGVKMLSLMQRLKDAGHDVTANQHLTKEQFAALLAADDKVGGEAVAWIDAENLPIPSGQSCLAYAGPGPANFNRVAVYTKPVQTRQAEPVKGYLHLKPPFEDENGNDISGEYITLQAHREAMAARDARWQESWLLLNADTAKKDAALKACVEALKRKRTYQSADGVWHDTWDGDLVDAAIQQAQKVLK